jgi:hypothetical protein
MQYVISQITRKVVLKTHFSSSILSACIILAMGINYEHLKYIEKVVRESTTPLDILLLGRQDCTDRSKRAEELIRRNYESVNLPVPNRRNTFFADTLFLDCGWGSVVDSIDISNYEGANLVHDLNVPLQLERKYDLIIDGGTLEHIFNVPIVLDNLSALLKVGGKVLHFSPANNQMGHGFYQFSPEFFASYYSSINGFSDTKIFLFDPRRRNTLFRVKIQHLSSRVEIMKSGRLQIWCEATKDQDGLAKVIQQTDYLAQWKEFEAAGISPRKSVLKGKLAGKIVSMIKKHRFTYFFALGLYKSYRKVYWHSIANWNPDLIAIKWK